MTESSLLARNINYVLKNWLSSNLTLSGVGGESDRIRLNRGFRRKDIKWRGESDRIRLKRGFRKKDIKVDQVVGYISFDRLCEKKERFVAAPSINCSVPIRFNHEKSSFSWFCLGFLCSSLNVPEES